jgi:hypothetical protein
VAYSPRGAVEPLHDALHRPFPQHAILHRKYAGVGHSGGNAGRGPDVGEDPEDEREYELACPEDLGPGDSFRVAFPAGEEAVVRARPRGRSFSRCAAGRPLSYQISLTYSVLLFLKRDLRSNPRTCPRAWPRGGRSAPPRSASRSRPATLGPSVISRCRLVQLYMENHYTSVKVTGLAQKLGRS